MMPRRTMDIDVLRSLLEYNPETGQLTWRVRRGGTAVAGSMAGSIGGLGYRSVHVDGRMFVAHRLVWALVYGEWPAQEIDHINCDKTDNRLANLRLCTHSANQANKPITRRNSSGFKGVSWCRRSGRWISQIQVNGRAKHLGAYSTAEEAARAYDDRARLVFGEFSRVNGLSTSVKDGGADA